MDEGRSLLPAPPPLEVPCTMEKRNDGDVLFIHKVEESVGMDKHLTD